MKKSINAIGTLSLCFIICFTTLKAQARYAVLTGKVAPEVSSIIVVISSHHGLVTTLDTIKPASDGTFKHNIQIKNPQVVYLRYGDHTNVELWLKPYSRLFVDLRSKTPEFKGADAIFSQYYISDHDFWSKIYADHKQRNPHFDEGDNQYTDKYFIIQDSMITERTNFLKKYFPKTANKDVYAFIKEGSLSFYYSNMYYKLMFSKADVEKFKFYQDKYHIKRIDYYDFSDKADFNNISLLSIDYYREFFCAMVTEAARRRIKDKGEKVTFSKLIDLGMPIIDEFAAGANINIELKAIFLNSFEWEVKANKSLEMANEINAAISTIPNWKVNTSLKIIKGKNDEIIRDTKFNKGNQAPDFAFKDVAGKIYSIKDFKEKDID